ncbi:MAG: RimK/LysX family protein [Gammaproteobacteria bacterium]|nr:RimK/LysX family protein [Gammaproteobacteria bacterium]
MAHRFWFRLVLLLVMIFSGHIVYAADKMVIGWIEQVRLEAVGLTFLAKIDTGADNSSIKAEILEKYQRDGVEWIRFRITNKQAQSVVLEREVVRYANIKAKKGPRIRRPVVLLGLCLGKDYRKIQVNLAERKRFKYHMLIGRSFLKGFYLVDSELKHTASPDCNDKEKN